MQPACLALTILTAVVLTFSGVMKIRRDPKVVKVIHEIVVYFVGAVVSHLRVGDAAGIGSAAFIFALSSAALVTRWMTM